MSVQELMAAAGLTHGGFYRHFDIESGLRDRVGDLAVDGFLAVLDEIPAIAAAAGAPPSGADGLPAPDPDGQEHVRRSAEPTTTPAPR